ncbi:MAG TPA: zinc-binding alcohol dehydrogenase [bacterium]|nr:zinc-binding alcohol dehydrogenase [bacterium]
MREEEIKDVCDDEIIVKAEWTQISVGTEVASIKMAQKEKREAWLGYSFVGIVVEKGKNVAINEGDRILALAPHASYVKVKCSPQWIVKVPEGVPPDIATVGILGSVAFHIVERAEIKLCESVGILGLGMVGSLCLQLSKISGARPVIGIDINDERLKIAEEYGADYCFNPDKVNLEEEISKITNGEMLNVVIEAVTKASTINIAKNILGMWGRLILTSYTNELISFKVNDDIILKELKIIGAHQPKCPVEKVPYYPFSQVKNRILSMEFLRDGILKVDKLITHRIKKDKIPEIYSLLLESEKRPTGILIDWR